MLLLYIGEEEVLSVSTKNRINNNKIYWVLAVYQLLQLALLHNDVI